VAEHRYQRSGLSEGCRSWGRIFWTGLTRLTGLGRKTGEVRGPSTSLRMTGFFDMPFPK
jgi:hypothetical protein